MSFKRDELFAQEARRLRIFTNIFLKASSVAGLIATIGKEAGKEEFKQAFNKTNNNTLSLPCYSLEKSNYSQQIYTLILQGL